VCFTDAEARAAFLDEYLATTARLIERYAAPSGETFTVTLIAHPKIEETRS